MGLKSAPTPPPAPDPARLAAAQSEANVKSTVASAILNQINQVGPGGTTTFEQIGGQNVGGTFVPRFQQTVTLSPEQQAQFEQQRALGGSLTGLAQEQTGRIGQALGQGIDTSGLPGLQTGVSGINVGDLSNIRGDFAQQGRELEQATFQRGLNLLAPELSRQQGDVERIITERGLPVGSQAAQERVFAPFEERRNQALENLALSSIGAGRQEQGRLFGQASQLRGQEFGERAAQAQARNAAAAIANAARGQGFQEQSFQRSLPIQDIASLLGTAPGVQQPLFQSTPAFGIQAPDVIGANLGANQIAQQNFATQQQQRGGLLGGLFGLAGSLGSAAIASDRRLKSNITKVGKTPKGFNLYKYIIDGTEQLGVMAQEVMETLPSAVVMKNGYLAVNYAEVS